jgi:Mg-chelatase subunit ChlD
MEKTPSVQNLVSMKMKCLRAAISKKELSDPKFLMPLLVSIKTEDVENEDFRQALDLVLVIDVSGSMKGQKIELVKTTLDFVIDELDERDRISIITFNSNINKICGLKSMTKANKEGLKELCKKKLIPKGCTNIKKAMTSAYNVLIERTQANDSSAIFLISDGQDTCGNNLIHIETAINDKIKKMKAKSEVVQVHTFGYGDDHDEKVLAMISRSAVGNFYYIKNPSFIDECFIDSFGYLMSSFGKNVELEVHLANGVSFGRAQEGSWDIKTDRVGVIQVPTLALGKSLDFVAEIKFDSKKVQYQKDVLLKVGSLDMNFNSLGKVFTFDDQLKIKMVETDGERGESCVEVEESYVKFQASEVMKEAKKKLDAGKEKESKWMVDDFVKRSDQMGSLGTRFKKELYQKVNMSNVRSSKKYHQAQFMLERDCFNAEMMAPEYQNYNFKQKKMRSRKI